jgi:hypothetical protein
MLYKDNIIHQLMRSYFNSSPYILNKEIIKNKKISLKRILISKPEIKHTVNEVIITIYSFNKYKLYLLNMIKKLNNLFFVNLIKFKEQKIKFNNKLKL